MHGYSGPRPAPLYLQDGGLCSALVSEYNKAWIGLLPPVVGWPRLPVWSSFSHKGSSRLLVVVHEAHLRLGSPEGASGAFRAGSMTALTWKPGVLALWTAALRQERWVMATPRHIASSWICLAMKEARGGGRCFYSFAGSGQT